MTALDAVRDTARDQVRGALVAGLRLRGGLFGELLSRQSTPDPYPLYDRIRAAGPLVRTPVGALSTDHATIERVLRHPATRTATVARQKARRGNVLERFLFAAPDRGDLVEPVGPESMIGMDGAAHARLRRLTSAVFTPAAVARLRPRLTSIVEDLVDRAAGRPTFDLMGEVAGVFPVLAICEVLGVPHADHVQFKAWGNDLASGLDASSSTRAEGVATAALAGLNAYMVDLLAQRRADPGDDLVSAMVRVEEDGDTLGDREVLATTMLLLVAGFETTVNLLGNGTLALLRHPAQLAWLREDPAARLPGAVEEMLRFDAPVQLTARYLGEPMQSDRGEVPAGTQVSLALGGANRDPAVFTDPHRLDLARPNARRHLAFASGPHYCLGAALARLEGEVAFGALLARLPELRMAAPARRRRTFVLRGLRTLPLVGAPTG